MIVQHIINYLFLVIFLLSLFSVFLSSFIKYIIKELYAFYPSCKVMFYNKNLLHSEILLLRIKFTKYPLTIFSFTLSHHNYCCNSLPKWKFNFTTFQTFTQFQLNFPTMPFSSNFRMLISQQSSTTPV